MSVSERRTRKGRKAKTPEQIRQALAKSQGRHIHPGDGYLQEYPGKFHRESCRETSEPLDTTTPHE